MAILIMRLSMLSTSGRMDWMQIGQIANLKMLLMSCGMISYTQWALLQLLLVLFVCLIVLFLFQLCWRNVVGGRFLHRVG